jgi:deoxyribodipyrimidine photo-lyase
MPQNVISIKARGITKNMTTLSPWIRHRLLLEEEVVAAAISTHGFSSLEKFIQEVFWRTY